MDENRLAEFAAGALAGRESQDVEDHVAGCERCRSTIAIVAAGDRIKGLGRTLEPEVAVALAEPIDAGPRIGRYVLEGEIGRGSMGVVYAARDPLLGRRIAVKQLRLAVPGPTQQDHLLTEARALARLSHANIVAVHDAGIDDGRVFIVMDLVEGASLRQWLAAGARATVETVRVFVAAGRGLSAAHRAGVAHGDFKPDNVLVADDGAVRVTDFGLARLARDPNVNVSTESIERTGIAGTPAYMAPEQHLGLRAEPASDQFAFCLSLHEALWGRHPLLRPRQGRPAPAHDRVLRRLRPVLLRGMSVVPQDRHANMDALLGGMEQAMAPPSRRASGLTITVAAALVLGAAIIGLTAKKPSLPGPGPAPVAAPSIAAPSPSPSPAAVPPVSAEKVPDDVRRGNRHATARRPPAAATRVELRPVEPAPPSPAPVTPAPVTPAPVTRAAGLDDGNGVIDPFASR